jgi:hypothetical protein
MIATFVEAHDKKVHRFLEMALGFLTWMLLLSPIWLGVFYPQAIVYMLTFFTVYWSFLSFRHTYGMIVGYKKYRDEMAADWYANLLKLDYASLPDPATLPGSLSAVRHFILIPTVNEPEGVLRDTVDAIFSQTFPSTQIVLVFTIEEKYAVQTEAAIRKVVGDREKELFRLLIYVHPRGIPGEAIGAGAANRTWGATHAVADLKAAGENLRDYIFSNIDADHVIDRQYLARLTHLYLTTARRDNHYYSSAVPLFNNNLWRVPPMMRIEANAVTMGVLSDWIVTNRSLKDTFSSYSCSLQTLIDANFWDVSLGVDDTIFYWRAFIARNGDFDGIPHFIPYNADAVEGKSFLDSHIALYKQLLRWGWGAIDFPLSVKEFLKNKKINRGKKIAWFIKHIERRVLLVNIVFMITFGFSLVTLVNPYVKQSNFAYSLPNIMSVILNITLVCIVPATYLRLKLATPMPKEWPLWKKFFVFLEGPLVVLNLLTYSFFPWVEAQTRMMLGKKMKDLYHTPKVR